MEPWQLSKYGSFGMCKSDWHPRVQGTRLVQLPTVRENFLGGTS